MFALISFEQSAMYQERFFEINKFEGDGDLLARASCKSAISERQVRDPAYISAEKRKRFVAAGPMPSLDDFRNRL